MAADNDRARALELALSQIEKQFGRGAVIKLGDGTPPPTEVISTGSLALDIALGIGGVPRGRVTEIFGPESSGTEHAPAAGSTMTRAITHPKRLIRPSPGGPR